MKRYGHMKIQGRGIYDIFGQKKLFDLWLWPLTPTYIYVICSYWPKVSSHQIWTWYVKSLKRYEPTNKVYTKWRSNVTGLPTTPWNLENPGKPLELKIPLENTLETPGIKVYPWKKLKNSQWKHYFLYPAYILLIKLWIFCLLRKLEYSIIKFNQILNNGSCMLFQ